MSNLVTLLCGDAIEQLKTLPDESVQCVVTSPPYYKQRDYECVGQIGLEETPDVYVCKLRMVFREVKRVLKKDGTLWLNMGDSYSNDSNWAGDYMGKNHPHRVRDKKIGRVERFTGLGPKNLLGMPWRVAFGLQEDGWILRSDIIWSKPNPLPESVRDRPTKAHEYLFLFAKRQKYYYNAEAIKEPASPNTHTKGSKYHEMKKTAQQGTGIKQNTSFEQAIWGKVEKRNKRSVWTVGCEGRSEAHFATFPTKLIEPCILAGSKPGDIILDPFVGSGTTLSVAARHGRSGIGIDLNPEYLNIARAFICKAQLPMDLDN